MRAWSFSHVELFERCKLCYKLRYIDKIKDEEPSPALERGKRVDDEITAYYNGQRDLPDSLALFADAARQLKELKPFCNNEWGFTRKWEPCGWFDDTTWLRVKLDIGVVYPDGTALVIDDKTGKRYPSHKDQLELYAIALMCRYPDVSYVDARDWYLDLGWKDEDCLDFHRSDLPAAKARWEMRVHPMLTAETFPLVHSANCRTRWSKKK